MVSGKHSYMKYLRFGLAWALTIFVSGVVGILLGLVINAATFSGYLVWFLSLWLIPLLVKELLPRFQISVTLTVLMVATVYVVGQNSNGRNFFEESIRGQLVTVFIYVLPIWASMRARDRNSSRGPEGLKWLDNYSGQTTEELIALEGKFRIDSIVVAFDQALNQKDYRLGDLSLAEEEMVVLAVVACEGQVNNGGYNQFFFNSSKEYVPIIVAALNRIGCTEQAELTQEAIDTLGIERPVTMEAVDNAMAEDDGERDEKLESCTSRYFDIAGDLADPLFEFIKKNRDKILLTD